MTEFSILAICTGNICRSPFAEAVLRSRLTVQHRGVVVRSAGTYAVVGAPIHERSAEELALRGGSAESFRARQLVGDMLAAADLVLTMTRDQRAHCLQEHPRALKRIFTLREFAALLRHLEPASSAWDLPSIVSAAVTSRSELADSPPSSLDIADPYGRGPAAYRTMADEIIAAVDTIDAELTRLLPR